MGRHKSRRMLGVEGLEVRRLLVAGDFNNDSRLDVQDVDLLTATIREGRLLEGADLDGNGTIDGGDLNFWVHDLKATFFGDTNLDGSFDSFDLVEALQAGAFNDASAAVSWQAGDWNGDGQFNNADLNLALIDGGFESRPGMQRLTQTLVTGQPDADVQLTYDPATGSVQLAALGAPISSVVLLSSAGQLSRDFAPGLVESQFDAISSQRLFVFRPAGVELLALGELLPADLASDQLLDDLRIAGSLVGGGSFETNLNHPDLGEVIIPVLPVNQFPSSDATWGIPFRIGENSKATVVDVSIEYAENAPATVRRYVYPVAGATLIGQAERRSLNLMPLPAEVRPHVNAISVVVTIGDETEVYRFAVNHADRFEPNDLPSTATRLGAFRQQTLERLILDTAVDNDRFDLRIQRSGVLQIQLNSSDDLDPLRVVVRNTTTGESEVGLLPRKSDTRHTYATTVTAGHDYQVEISAPAGLARAIPYDLTLLTPGLAADANDAMEPNNNLPADATDLTGANPLLDAQAIQFNGDVDWFKWTAAARGQFVGQILFDGAHGDAELSVHDNEGRLLTRATTVTSNESVSLPVLAGDELFIRVAGINDATELSYQLINYFRPDETLIFVASNSDRTVRVFNDQLEAQPSLQPAELMSMTRLGDVELGPQGQVYVAASADGDLNSTAPYLFELTPTGQLIRQIQLPLDINNGDGPIQAYPDGFEILADGTILVAQPNSDQVVRLQTVGSLDAQGRQAVNRVDLFLTEPGAQPRDATVTTDGQVVWTAASAGTHRVNPTFDAKYWTSGTSATLWRSSGGERTASAAVAAMSLPIEVQEVADLSLYSIDASGLTHIDRGGVTLAASPVAAAVGLAVSSGENAIVVPVGLPDQDGDALPDLWEVFGIDLDGDGVPELELNTDPLHKDLFVEVDAMSRDAVLANLPAGCIANSWMMCDAAESLLKQMFADVPYGIVFNPDGSDGVTLHLEIDDLAVPEYDFAENANDVWPDFHRLKENYFGTAAQRAAGPHVLQAKSLVYRYALFGRNRGTVGRGGLAEEPGRNLLVTLGTAETPGGTDLQQAAAFAHELGHTLGLSHGGHDDTNLKPNYLSVMNYAYFAGTALTLDPVTDELVAAPFLDFSRYAAQSPLRPYHVSPLDETSLAEADGLGFVDPTVGYYWPLVFDASNGEATPLYGPVNWDGDPDSMSTANVVDINAHHPGEYLTSQNDWAALRFEFTDLHQSSDGNYVNAQSSSDEPTTTVCEQIVDTGNVNDPNDIGVLCNDLPVIGSPTPTDEDTQIEEYVDIDWFILELLFPGDTLIALTPESTGSSLKLSVYENLPSLTENPTGPGLTPLADGQTFSSLSVGSTFYLKVEVDPAVTEAAFVPTAYTLSITPPAPTATAWTSTVANAAWSVASNWLLSTPPSATIGAVFQAATNGLSVNLQTASHHVHALYFEGRSLKIDNGSLDVTSGVISVASGNVATVMADLTSVSGEINVLASGELALSGDVAADVVTDTAIIAGTPSIVGAVELGAGASLAPAPGGQAMTINGELTIDHSLLDFRVQRNAVVAGAIPEAGQLAVAGDIFVKLAGDVRIQAGLDNISVATHNDLYDDVVIVNPYSLSTNPLPTVQHDIVTRTGIGDILCLDGNGQIITGAPVCNLSAQAVGTHVGNGVFLEDFRALDEAVDGGDGFRVTLAYADVGDSNVDGVFNSSDLIQLFTLGLYGTSAQASWFSGDWNRDGQFDSGDIVYAFQVNKYVA